MSTDRAMEQELNRLRARVEQLEGERRTSRRRMLGLAGAAAAGGAASLMGANTAGATSGAMFFGLSNDAGASTTTLTSSSVPTFACLNSAGATAVRGVSTGGGTGVIGRIDSPSASAYGLWGLVTNSLGYAVVGDGGQAQLFLTGSGGPTVNVAHTAGELAYDGASGTFWACVQNGTPGTWRKLGSLSTAGSFHPITPKRVHDTRVPSANPIATGVSRTISVAHSITSGGASNNDNLVPSGATAIAFTITVVDTVNKGFLAVNPGGVSTVSASTINWSSSSLVLANSSVVKLNSNRQITVICGGTATSTNFIVDVVGYYL